MLIKKKVFVKERDQLRITSRDLDEPEDPMDHLLLNVMFDRFQSDAIEFPQDEE